MSASTLRERAEALAIATAGRPLYDAASIGHATQALLTLRSLGWELVSHDDLAEAIEGTRTSPATTERDMAFRQYQRLQTRDDRA